MGIDDTVWILDVWRLISLIFEGCMEYWSYLRGTPKILLKVFFAEMTQNGSCEMTGHEDFDACVFNFEKPPWTQLSTLTASKSMSNLNLAIWVSIWFNDWLSLVSFCKLLKVWYSTTENHIRTHHQWVRWVASPLGCARCRTPLTSFANTTWYFTVKSSWIELLHAFLSRQKS